ncbi:MAG: rod shape-determining protein MreD [Syntrophobacteraceae bacterium]|nr:rod shape-determining protein MreD [Syntrophobacteraceae bacterium]
MNGTSGMEKVRLLQNWQYLLKVSLYSLLLLLLQAAWNSRVPSPTLKADFLLPIMLAVAVEWPAVGSLGWAIVWGFVADTLSGKLWGFHVGSYVLSICLVHIAAEKFEFQNPLYQMFFVGVCSMIQSVVLGMFLLLEPSGSMLDVTAGRDLVGRFIFTMVLTPLIIAPIWKNRAQG